MNLPSLRIFLLVALLLTRSTAAGANSAPEEPILGMYVHQHWAYNHPYAARTWTQEDWEGYLRGIRDLGYNTVVIWPVLETVPQPLTESDAANLQKIAKVIEHAQERLRMKVYIVLCPNVSAKDHIARQYTFEKRPFFRTDDRVDPGDPVAFGKLMAWRERLMRPLAHANGIFVIDSDPGGYPGSTLLEFVYILGAHRRMLDRLRPGMELVYWAAHGWESYGKFYSTAETKYLGKNPDENRETIKLIARQPLEPWLVASARGPDLADSIGFGSKVVAFNYGAIEYEPAFPFTVFGQERTRKGGADRGPRGVIGNSQTHCVQLPNAFAFARAARDQPTERTDYVAFANRLIPGHGDMIVQGWEALQGSDAERIEDVARALELLQRDALPAGTLDGLLFGNPSRFVGDLVLQLRATAGLHRFRESLRGEPRDERQVAAGFRVFVDAVSDWQARHGYSNHWRWPAMQEALSMLHSAPIDATLRTLSWVSEEGETPFDRVKNGLARLEDYTPRLLEAMRQELAAMESRLDKANLTRERERERPARGAEP